jgi:hypothetical protein
MGNYKNNSHLVSFVDGEMYITCRVCGETKPEDYFDKNKNNKFGRTYACRVCIQMNDKGTITLENADERYASGAREILIGMGYDISKDIHTQFLQRMKDKGRNL